MGNADKSRKRRYVGKRTRRDRKKTDNQNDDISTAAGSANTETIVVPEDVPEEATELPAPAVTCEKDDNSDFHFIINTSVLLELIKFMNSPCKSCGNWSQHKLDRGSKKIWVLPGVHIEM